MPAYNFQEPFVPLILSGLKRTTIRRTAVEPGKPAHLFTGLRTAQCRRLGKSEVVQCAPIVIGRKDNGGPDIKLRERKLSLFDADILAQQDGFIDAADMVKWFEKTYKLQVNVSGCAQTIFSGYLIEWAPL